MAPEVFFTVCYSKSRLSSSVVGKHSFHPAILADHSRRRVRWEDYPGATEQAGHTIRGTFATGLSDANMRRLDVFEGSEYERRKVKVKVLGDGDGDDGGSGAQDTEEVEAWVYIFNNPGRLEEKEWDYEEFRREKLQRWSRADYVFEGTPAATD